MSKPTGSYPSLTVDATAKRVVSQAGAVLLVATAGRVRLDRAFTLPRPTPPDHHQEPHRNIESGAVPGDQRVIRLTR